MDEAEMANGNGGNGLDNALETDFIGSGWGFFPLRLSKRGGIDLARGADDVSESIRMILSTPIGERRMRPNFGCGVHDLVFATNTPATHGLIRYHVAQALELWEPRIELGEDGVRVRVDPDQPERVLIEITYTLRGT